MCEEQKYVLSYLQRPCVNSPAIVEGARYIPPFLGYVQDGKATRVFAHVELIQGDAND